jgi:hypothetical protein
MNIRKQWSAMDVGDRKKSSTSSIYREKDPSMSPTGPSNF